MQAADRDAGIEFDLGVEVLGLVWLGIQVKEGYPPMPSGKDIVPVVFLLEGKTGFFEIGTKRDL
jgi:hypothetical protein